MKGNHRISVPNSPSGAQDATWFYTLVTFSYFDHIVTQIDTKTVINFDGNPIDFVPNTLFFYFKGKTRYLTSTLIKKVFPSAIPRACISLGSFAL